jgi:hypothetical protein
MRSRLLCAASVAVLLSCRSETPRHVSSLPVAKSAAGEVAIAEPNEFGRIPILEYHLFGREGRWSRSADGFRRDLELLYTRGYRPVTVAQLVRRELDLPAGQSPVVFTFDDASPGQFRFIERGDSLVVDPESAVGIWLDMHRRHPDWGNRATFCLLPAAKEGHAFFGDKGIEGQKTEWRFRKVRMLADLGFELCDHTLWHATLNRYSDTVVQEQIARGVAAIDSAVPGYKVRTFALPLGVWPKNRNLAQRGAWRDARSGRVFSYEFNAVLEVAGGPVRSPHDSAFDALRLKRIEVFGDAVERTVAQLDASGTRYISDGDPKRVSGRQPVITARVERPVARHVRRESRR